MRGAPLGLRLVFPLFEYRLKQFILLLLRVVLIIIVVLVVPAECNLCLGPLHHLVRVLPISQLLLPGVIVVVLGRQLLVDHLIVDRLLAMTARDTPSLAGALLPGTERAHTRVPRVSHALLRDKGFGVVEVEASLCEKGHNAFFGLLLLLHFI